LMASLLAISACSSGSEQAHEYSNPALDDLSSFVANMGFDPNVSPLAEILADNKLDLVEYESVANDVVDCLAASGIQSSAYYTESPGTSGYGFRSTVPEGMLDIDAALDECERTTQFTAIAFTWASMVGPTEDENDEITVLVDNCLQEAGVEGGREATIGDSSLTDTFLACADDATTEVLSRR
ncbi:MAG: hypothetical protein QNL12_07130, partial [Acidimicrobiia bacterium]|nr:hypothetical protein [Acidimicrobiia bacterium]